MDARRRGILLPDEVTGFKGANGQFTGLFTREVKVTAENGSIDQSTTVPWQELLAM